VAVYANFGRVEVLQKVFWDILHRTHIRMCSVEECLAAVLTADRPHGPLYGDMSMNGIIEATSLKGLIAQKKAIVEIRTSDFVVEDFFLLPRQEASDASPLVRRLASDRQSAPIAVALPPDGTQSVWVPSTGIYSSPEIGPMCQPPDSGFTPTMGYPSLLERLLESARGKDCFSNAKGARFDHSDDCVSRITWWRLQASLEEETEQLWGDMALITNLEEKAIIETMTALEEVKKRINLVTSQRHLAYEFTRYLLGGESGRKILEDPADTSKHIVLFLWQEDVNLNLLQASNYRLYPLESQCDVNAAAPSESLVVGRVEKYFSRGVPSENIRLLLDGVAPVVGEQLSSVATPHALKPEDFSVRGLKEACNSSPEHLFLWIQAVLVAIQGLGGGEFKANYLSPSNQVPAQLADEGMACWGVVETKGYYVAVKVVRKNP
jgi:hypothetical protein